MLNVALKLLVSNIKKRHKISVNKQTKWFGHYQLFQGGIELKRKNTMTKEEYIEEQHAIDSTYNEEEDEELYFAFNKQKI